jgi:DNA-binding NarL/FixJ family response regulator
MPDSDLRVLVISDHPYTRVGIVSALSGQPHLQIAGQTDSDSALTDLVTLYLPDAIIWEIPYEAASSQLRLGEIRDLDIPVLVLLHDEQRTAELLAAGARGVLPRDADAETIATALLALQTSLVVVHTSLPLFVDAPSLTPPLSPTIDILTSRELEVLRLVAEGLPNKQIAIALKVSEHTVKFHINAIMGKLGVQSRTEAVVRATRQGLIAL